MFLKLKNWIVMFSFGSSRADFQDFWWILKPFDFWCFEGVFVLKVKLISLFIVLLCNTLNCWTNISCSTDSSNGSWIFKIMIDGRSRSFQKIYIYISGLRNGCNSSNNKIIWSSAKIGCREIANWTEYCYENQFFSNYVNLEFSIS